MKYNYRYYLQDSEEPKDIAERETHWISVDGAVLDKVELWKFGRYKSNKNYPLIEMRDPEVTSKIRKSRRDVEKTVTTFEPERAISARVNEDGGTLPQGIQLYRLWFTFLKLALQLESLGKDVQLTVQQRTPKIKRNPEDLPQELKDERKIKSRSKITTRVKVDRDKYEGWDLDQVETQSFRKWWETHHYLFEGYAPKIITSKKEWDDDPNFIYVRIDKTVTKGDIQRFVTNEISRELLGKPRYALDKTLKPDVLTNAFNCLVHTLIHSRYDMTDKQFFEGGYLRGTTASSGKDGEKGKGIAVPTATDENRVKEQYAGIIRPRRLEGIKQLIRVMEGGFGNISHIKFTNEGTWSSKAL